MSNTWIHVPHNIHYQYYSRGFILSHQWCIDVSLIDMPFALIASKLIVVFDGNELWCIFCHVAVSFTPERPAVVYVQIRVEGSARWPSEIVYCPSCKW